MMDLTCIYLDNAATTRVSEEAAQLAYACMTKLYANPSSAHAFGFEAETALKTARERVLTALGVSPRDGNIVFTSCGTEADNMAVFGAAAVGARKGKHIVISDAEHPAVNNAAKELEKQGCTVSRVPTKGGRLDMDFAGKAITPDTVLVSCMAVNNETGAMFDIASLCALTRKQAPHALFHTDAVQAFTKVPRLADSGADLISLSGHKIHAPKGIGALYIKKGVRMPTRMFGGAQENGLRAGTEALPNIAAFGLAAQTAAANININIAHYGELKQRLTSFLTSHEGFAVNSGDEGFAPHIVSIAVPGIRSEILLRALSAKGIYVSAGSACSSKHADNRVLSAFGLSDAIADSTVRVSFSAYTTNDEIDRLCEALVTERAALLPTTSRRG